MSSRRVVPPTVTAPELLAAVREARAETRADFERTIAVLREENSTLRRMLETTARRADELASELLKSLATAPVRPPAMQPLVAPPPRTSKDPIAGLGNVLEPVGFDHPDASFKSMDEASLLFPTTEGAEGAEGEHAAAT